MNKKTAIQGLMILLIILIISSFYVKYFKKNPRDLTKNITVEKPNINESTKSNYIDNVNYVSSNTKGNEYQMTAEQAEIKVENPDVMHLINVIAYIFVKNSDTIKITSDFGKYNSKNYDTIFSENVIVTYPGQKITGEYLDFSFLNNLGTFTTNVIYTGEKTNLFADKIEMNLITKDTKIFMIDSEKKVLIKGTK